jgi:SAM-dependent methyltransferase
VSDSDKNAKSSSPSVGESPVAVHQHNAEIHENLHHWNRKPELRAEYAKFYQLIADWLPSHNAEDVILECGSGIGNLKSVLPHAITSDLFPNPWLDRQENIYALTFPEATVTGIVLFDVFHHLRYPGTALKELQRVLRPGGTVVIMEPAAGILGRLALGLFHHEPLALNEHITWTAPTKFDPVAVDYYAAQGNAWRIFGSQQKQLVNPGWKLVNAHYLPALPWVATGGFRGPNLNKGILRPLLRIVDKLLSMAPRLFAARMMVVLQKTAD